MTVTKPKVKGCRLRGENYFLDKVVRGVHLTECVGPDPQIAAAILAKRLSEVWDGAYFPTRRESSLTVTHILSTYWDERLQFKTSGINRKYHLTRLRTEFGSVPVMDLTVSMIEKFCRKRLSERRVIRYRKENGDWAEKLGKQITPRTVNAELNELNAAIQWAVKNRILKYNPIAAMQKVDEPEPAKVMLDNGVENGSDWQRLYNAASGDLKPIIHCQYLTGMRIGEVLSLRWQWVDMPARIIHLPATSTKTRRSRDIPMSEELIALFMSIQKRIDLVFPKENGDPRKDIGTAFDGAVTRAGWPRGYFTTHALRRTRGQIWDSVDRHLSSKALGHDEAIHDQHYTRVTSDMLLQLTMRRSA